MPYTAKERRILITQWAGEAWNALNSSKYDKQRKKCWSMTGCLLTADGSEDNLVKPEGLDDYVVAAPSIVDALVSLPKENSDQVVPAEVDPDSIDPDLVVIEDTDEILGADEEEGERNIFDFIDNLCEV